MESRVLCDRNGNPSSTATLRPESHDSKGEQFRATRVWNDIVYSFYNGIELNKHRYHMRSYYDCFTSSEAVTWLKRFLRDCEHFPNTGTKVTRFQALNLLRKFHSTNIIERVIQKSPDKDLQDNGELFRFTREANENVPFLGTSTLPGVDKSFVKIAEDDVDIEKVELNQNEKQEVHRKVVWEMMLKIEPKMIGKLKYEQICGTSVYDAIHRVNTNGVVQLRDKSTDLPHWLLSAMKCLAAWPKASGTGNCLPKYPGFESDVFALVREFFHNAPEPVIPFEFYSLLIETFEKFRLDIGLIGGPVLNVSLDANGTGSRLTTFSQQSRYSTLPNRLSNKSTGVGFSGLSTPTVKTTKTTTPTVKSGYLPDFSTFSRRSKIVPTLNVNGFVPAPSCVYETEFNDAEPITKIVPIEPASTVSQSFANYFERQAQRQPFPQSTVELTEFELRQPAGNTFEQSESRMTESSTLNRRHFRKNNSAQQQNPNQQNILPPVSSFSALSTIPRKSTKLRLAAELSTKQQAQCYGADSTFDHSSFEISLNVSTSTSAGVPTIAVNGIGVESTEKHHKSNRFYKLIQLILLILPSPSRRHLHLLIRLFFKIIRNKELCILQKDSQALKQHIVTIFTRSLIRCESEVEYSETKARLFIDFLIDECMNIFEIPDDLKADIDSSLTKLKKQKGTEEQNFCAKVSQAEFELQRDVLSEYALTDLLQSIMRDDSLSERDKLKWIKQFKLYHPEVYDIYFGTASSQHHNHHHQHQQNTSHPTASGGTLKKCSGVKHRDKENNNHLHRRLQTRSLSLFNSLQRPIKRILSG